MSPANRNEPEANKLDRMVQHSASIDVNLDFSSDELEQYLAGTADQSIVSIIEAERRLDPEFDQELRIIENTQHVSTPVTSDVRQEIRKWQWITGGFGATACTCAALAFFTFMLAKKSPELVYSGATADLIKDGGKYYSRSQISSDTAVAFERGFFEPSAAWAEVAPLGGTKSEDYFAIESPKDTTLEDSSYVLVLPTLTGIKDLKVLIRRNGATDSKSIRSSATTLEFSSPGKYLIIVQGISSDGRARRTEFRLRVMDATESGAYRQAKDTVNNDFERLAIYQRFGMRHLYEAFAKRLGKSAPRVDN